MTRVLASIAGLFLLCASVAAAAQNADLGALMANLKGGGYVIVLRHGATNRDQADTDPLNHDNVARQRLLSERLDQGGRCAMK